MADGTQGVMGPGGMGSGYIDGVFSDDVQGLGEEHPNVRIHACIVLQFPMMTMASQAAPSMGLTDAQVLEIQEATQAAWTQMLQTLLPNQGYNWQVGRSRLLGPAPHTAQAFGDQDGVASSVSQSAIPRHCGSAKKADPGWYSVFA